MWSCHILTPVLKLPYKDKIRTLVVGSGLHVWQNNFSGYWMFMLNNEPQCLHYITCHILNSNCEKILTLDSNDSFSTSPTYLSNDTVFHKYWIQTPMCSTAKDFIQQEVNQTRTYHVTEYSNLDTHNCENLKSQLIYRTFLMHSFHKVQQIIP